MHRTLKWMHRQLLEVVAAFHSTAAVRQLAWVEKHWEWLVGSVRGERHRLVYLGVAVVREVLVLAATGGRKAEAEL